MTKLPAHIFVPILFGWRLRVLVDVLVTSLKVEGVKLAVWPWQKGEQRCENCHRGQHFGTAALSTVDAYLIRISKSEVCDSKYISSAMVYFSGASTYGCQQYLRIYNVASGNTYLASFSKNICNNVGRHLCSFSWLCRSYVPYFRSSDVRVYFQLDSFRLDIIT